MLISSLQIFTASPPPSSVLTPSAALAAQVPGPCTKVQFRARPEIFSATIFAGSMRFCEDSRPSLP